MIDKQKNINWECGKKVLLIETTFIKVIENKNRETNMNKSKNRNRGDKFLKNIIVIQKFKELYYKLKVNGKE